MEETTTTTFENLANISSTHAAPVTNDHWPLFVTLVSISVLSLAITLILYMLTREKQTCQGWTSFSYLVALLLFDLVFVPALCPGLTNMSTDRNPTCYTLSVLNQYFFICSKTWLIIISIDMYLMIRKPRVGTKNMKDNLRRFFVYCIVGWFLPAIMVGAGVILNWKNRKKLPLDYDNLWTTVPDYGYLHCRIPNWFVWECFVFGNCIFHVFMFILISYTIFRQRMSFKSPESSSTRKRQSPFMLLLRLFIVVGLSWTYIAIQDLLRAGNINTKQTWFWHIFRCIFYLQGVFISAIVVTNGRTLSNLVLKYPQLKVFVCKWPNIQYNMGDGWLSKCFAFGDDNSRKGSIQSNSSQKTVDSVL